MDYLSCFKDLRKKWPRFSGGFCREISEDLAKIVDTRYPNSQVYLAYFPSQRKISGWIDHQIVVVKETETRASSMDACVGSENDQYENLLVISASDMGELVAELIKHYQGAVGLTRINKT